MLTITATPDLAEICRKLAEPGWFTIDTEFMRDRTYWSKLCLIQVATDGAEAIVDPLAEGLDLSPLFALLADTSVVKVFHAGRQDIEIFHKLGGIIPNPIFDTQVAAMVLGFGDSVSYDALSRKIVGEEIDKSSRFTDWARRPLSDKQLAYALKDVTYLRDIYKALKVELESTGRADWVEEELSVLTSPATYQLRPEDAWQRVKPKPRSRRGLAVLIDVAAWREREAQSADVPRNRILKDEALAEAAVNEPRSEADLRLLRAVPSGFERSRAAAGLLAAVEAGRKRDLSTVPALPQREPVPQRLESVVDLLKVVLRMQSRRQRVAQRLIATTEDLEQIALHDEADVPALNGWRRRIFGEIALDVKHGRKAIQVRDGKVRLIRPEAESSE